MTTPPRQTDEQPDTAALLIRQTIADRVAAALTPQGRYLTDVAAAADISQPTFSRKINGHTDFTIPELVRVADARGLEWTAVLAAPDRVTHPPAGCSCAPHPDRQHP